MSSFFAILNSFLGPLFSQRQSGSLDELPKPSGPHDDSSMPRGSSKTPSGNWAGTSWVHSSGQLLSLRPSGPHSVMSSSALHCHERHKPLLSLYPTATSSFGALAYRLSISTRASTVRFVSNLVQPTTAHHPRRRKLSETKQDIAIENSVDRQVLLNPQGAVNVASACVLEGVIEVWNVEEEKRF